jgi:putative membrane protein
MLLAALAASACGREKGTDARDAEPPPGGSVRLSDGDVVMLVTQVSTGEIAAASAARGKLQNPEVRAYAERMLAEHGAMNDQMRSLPVKGDTVSRPPLQFALRQAVSANEGALISTMPAGPAFDRTFIAMQVNGHSAALDSLRKWQRMVQTPAVRERIGGAIPTVEAHLSMARSIQSRLGPGTATGPILPPPPDTAWY